MKTILSSRKETPRRLRKLEIERGPFFGLILGIERNKYKRTKDLDITLLILCFSIRLSYVKYIETKNEYVKAQKNEERDGRR